MGNRCATSGCKERPHTDCINTAITCSNSITSKCQNGSKCSDCHGTNIKIGRAGCGHCAYHCDASSRTTVDFRTVQQAMSGLLSLSIQYQDEIKKLKEENRKLKGDDFMDEKELKECTQKISNLTQKLDKNDGDYKARKEIYNMAKKIYKQQKSPIFIHKNIKENIKSNKNKYKNKNTLPFTLTMDRDFQTFDKNKFKREFASKMNIPISAVKIISVTKGSTIVHTEITAFEQNGIKYNVGAIAEKMTEEEATKGLVEFGVFLAEFGEPIDAFKPLKQTLIMNPKWNRIYGPGNIEWEGTLNTDKTEPYYCPRGWKKFTSRVQDTSEEFDAKYKNWPVAYHGTPFSKTMMISFSRLRAGGDPNADKASGADCFGTGVYFSPSIIYAAHPLYAHPKKMSLDASEYAGKYVQVVLNCRIKPGSWSTHQATIGDTSKQIDPNYKNNELEWLVHAPQGTYLDEEKVVFCGYMIRTSDSDPQHLPTSKWWNLSEYGRKEWYE